MMRKPRIEYYTYKSFRARTQPRRKHCCLPWHQKVSDLRVVRIRYVAKSFDELVEYLDNGGSERELHVWMISTRDNALHLDPTDDNIIINGDGPIYPGTLFGGYWLSFAVSGYTFFKQMKKFKK